jgi:hypothetical protein
MPSLRESVGRTPAIRPRSLSLWMAPFIADRAAETPPRILEDAALTVLSVVFARSGPFREQLLLDRRRFDQLIGLVHRLPAASRGGTE